MIAPEVTIELVTIVAERGCWAALAIVAAGRFILKDTLSTVDELTQWRIEHRKHTAPLVKGEIKVKGVTK